MRWSLAVALVSVGCFSKPDPPHEHADDGGPDAPLPTEFEPFGTAVQIPLGPAGSYNDFEPTISDDQLVLAFGSTRDLGGTMRSRIWFVTRASTGVPFDMANVLPVNGVDDQAEPTMAPSGLELYFVQRGGTAVFVRFRRASTTGTSWMEVTPVDIPSVGPFDFVGSNVDHIIAGSTLDAGDPASMISEHLRSGGVTWTQRHPIDAPGADGVPAIRADGRELFYENLSGTTSTSLRATRDSIDVPFGPSTPFTITNFGHISDPELTANGEDLYFVGGAPLRIWVAHREPK